MPTTTATGRAAEQLAADYLQDCDFTIVDRNWRNRWCELDIVARRQGLLHFIEVKYRVTANHGAPMEYISRDKIARLTRAALAYNQAHSYFGPYQIDIIGLTGPLRRPVIEHLENAICA